jgi:hypothetical protein
MKAKEFWNTLSYELDYRFFSGVVCPGLLPLYKAMSSGLMHYIPAANERIAFGMVCGACTAGFKSGLLMDMRFIEDLYTLIPFAVNNNIPFILVGYDDGEKLTYDIPLSYVKDVKDIKKLVHKIESESTPGMMIIGKDLLI